MAYRIRHCRWESGERYCMLVDAETGMPPWWPTLYITTQVRNRGHSVATMEQALSSIWMLLRFAEAEEIDLEERVLTRGFSSWTRSIRYATQRDAKRRHER